MSLSSSSTCLLNNSRDGYWFIAMGSLLQCLTTILEKKLFLEFRGVSPLVPLETLSSGPFTCYMGGEPDPHLAKEPTNPATCPVGCGLISLPFALSSLPSPYLRLESWGRLPGRSCSEPPSAASGPRRRRPWGSGIRPAPLMPWSPLAAASAGTKRAGKKYHAVTGGAACGISTRRAPGEGGTCPDVLGHPCAPPQAWSFSLQGLEAKDTFAIWGHYGPHPTMCSLVWRSPVTWTQHTSSLVLLWSERQRKVFIQTKHNAPEQRSFYIAHIKILEKPGDYWWETSVCRTKEFFLQSRNLYKFSWDNLLFFLPVSDKNEFFWCC